MALTLAVTTIEVQAQVPLPTTITDGERKRVTAVRTGEDIVLDGRLDEAVWGGASQSGFIQAEPREGALATADTEVWVAYDESNLYIGAVIHDEREPTVNDIRKDFDDTNQDIFQVILDTFRDRRSGYVFQTNPEGARGDRQVANEGREVNRSWDAIWRVETSPASRGAGRWRWRSRSGPSASIRNWTVSWGINFGRTCSDAITRCHTGRLYHGAYTFNRLSLAG